MTESCYAQGTLVHVAGGCTRREGRGTTRRQRLLRPWSLVSDSTLSTGRYSDYWIAQCFPAIRPTSSFLMRQIRLRMIHFETIYTER